MKMNLALGMLAMLALTSAPAHADDMRAAVDEAKASDHAASARHQEHKAMRDAARGDVAGAERHSEEAREQSHRARHDEHKAIRHEDR